ncbi:MAG: hypothetical protein P8Z40_03145 [Chloroflexota bacterium]
MNSVRESASDRRMAWAWVIALLVLSLIFMERVLFPPPGEGVVGHDVRGLFYPWWLAARQAIFSGRFPLWQTYQFSGYPFFANPQVALFYPPTWLAILLPPHIGISWYVAFHIWLMGVGMLLFVRSLGGSWLGAGLAALTFSFGGFVAARVSAGHIGLLATHAWIPWLLIATQWAIRRDDLWPAILTGLVFGLAVLAGHVSSLLYVGLIWLAFDFYLALTVGRWLHIARQAVVAGLVGLALGAAQLLPFIQFAELSSRAGETAAEYGLWSLPPVHLITFFLPGYFGDPTVGYWSVDNFGELTYYVGMLPLLGIVLALRRPTRLTWLYLSLMVFGLLMALGTYGFLYPVLYDLLPPFRLSRAPGRAAFLFVFAACGLLGDTITHWQRSASLDERRADLRRLLRPTLIVAALLGVAGLAATGAAFAALHPSETAGRLWHQAGGWMWALVAFLAAGGLLWSYLAADPAAGRQREMLGIGLAGLVVADLWVFGFKLVDLQSLAPAPVWAEARAFVGETDQRVLPWGVGPFYTHNDGTLIGLHSVFGYNTLQVAAPQTLYEYVPDPRNAAYDILAASYVLTSDEIASQFTEGDDILQLVKQDGSAWLYRRANALPIIRLVYQVEVVEDSMAAVERVHQPEFDPAAVAILDQPPPCDLAPPDSPGTATVLDEWPGYWLIETESSAPALLVLSETAYPGWQVRVDGEPAASLTAYTAIRAVCVPAGSHQVEWRFNPPIFKVGAAISALALGLVAAAGGIVFWKDKAATPRSDMAQEADTNESGS